VQQIVGARAAPEREALFAWWRYHPDAFRIVRDRDGGACGLCVMVRASDLNEAVDASDPVAAAWRRDVARRDPSAALLCRRWLDRDVGEAPCASLAAFFVDLKRSYVEMRGTLRWVYTVVANPEPFGDFAARLGFRPLADATTDVGGQTMYSALLDMGPGSVDAWLAELMGAEITAEDIESSKRLDVEAHELVLSSGRVGLTRSNLASCNSAGHAPWVATTSWKQFGDPEARRRATSLMSLFGRCAGSLAPMPRAWRRSAEPGTGIVSSMHRTVQSRVRPRGVDHGRRTRQR
jgi:hypothetical protein